MKYLLLALLCAALITGMSACSFTVIDDPISSTRENTKETINTPATTDKNYTSETNKTEENIKDDEKTSGKVEILYKADDIELTHLQTSSSFRTYEFDDCIIYGTNTYEDVPKAYSQFTMYDKTDGKLLARSDKIFSLSLPYFSTFGNEKYLLSFDIEFNKDIIEIERKNDILTVNRITNDKEEDNKTEYPYYSTKITSQDGKYTAQIIEEDEKGHGGINIITDEKGHKRVLTDIAFGDWIADKNKKADEGDTLRHDLVSFIDNTRFIYLRIGYEWSCGFGIYDIKTNKNIIFEDMRIPTIYDGHIYAVSVSGDDYGWYDINTFFKIAPDGTKTDLDFNEIPSGRVLFQNGYWIIQFDSRSMPDNYGVPEGDYKTFLRVYTDDLDKKLLEVSVPNEFDTDTLLGNGFITPYNGRIFIPVDGSSLANTK